MKPYATATVLSLLLAACALQGCKNPCEGEINAMRARVMQFVEDTNPWQEGPQPCGTHEGSGNYDQICDYAVRALSVDWPFFDCNSCDALEIKLCSCYGENVWVVDDNQNPIYPGVVYCLANYYRTREMCECRKDFPGDQGNLKDCYVTGEMTYPGAPEIVGDGIDENCDGVDAFLDCPAGKGFGFDADEDGYIKEACGGTDCNDTNSDIHPGAEEVPGDGIDQNCDGVDLEENCPDLDDDDHMDAACGGDDCVDDPSGDDAICERCNCSPVEPPVCFSCAKCIHAEAREKCGDGTDQDCNGVDLICCPDLDGDGHKSLSCGGTDCNDDPVNDLSTCIECNCTTQECGACAKCIYPGALEFRDDIVDQDCNGVDLSGGCDDIDHDGYLDANCGGDDCDDAAYHVNPGLKEIPGDGVDQDCNGVDLARDCPDQDGDGYFDSDCGGKDCNDQHPGIYPGATEICENGIDDDCSGSDLIPCSCRDADGDGHFDSSCGGDDCDDKSVTRICAQPEKPQLKQHTLQQTDVCDALIGSFGCEHYDGDQDQIPDQYDGGAEMSGQYWREDPECRDGPPGEAAWLEWFQSPRSLYDGGKIFIDADGLPEDSDKDGVSNSCDNCPETPNGFDCEDVPQCDTNGDGQVDETEIRWSGQKDTNNDKTGDACDRDNDAVANDQDNCPDNPNGYECLESCPEAPGFLDYCDTNSDGELTLAELEQMEQTDPERKDDCLFALDPKFCNADTDDRVTLDDLRQLQQSDPSRLEDCLMVMSLDRCDFNENNMIEFNDLIQLDAAEQDWCISAVNEICSLIFRCDADLDEDVGLYEIQSGNQRDFDGDGTGDACEE